MKSQWIMLAAVGAVLPVMAKNWLGGDGNWSDTTKWQGGTMPLTDEMVYITHGTKFNPQQERASVINLDEDAYVHRLYVAEESGAGIDTSVPDSCRVVFSGLGSLYLKDMTSQVSVGRELVFKDVDVIFTNHSGSSVGNGRLSVNGNVTFDGGSLSMKDNASALAIDPTGRFIVKNGAAVEFVRAIWGAQGAMRLYDGSLRFSRNDNSVTMEDVIVENAEVVSACSAAFNTLSFLPREAGGVLDIQASGYHTLEPTSAPEYPVPLRGTLYVTNCPPSGDTSPQVAFKEDDFSLYGRGKLYAPILQLSQGHSLDLDLAEVNIGHSLRTVESGGGAVYNFHDVTLGSFDGTLGHTGNSWSVTRSPLLNFFGESGFDVSDRFGSASYALSIPAVMHPRSGIRVTGGNGEAGSVAFSLAQIAPVFTQLSVEKNTTMTISEGSSVPNIMRVRDLKLAAGTTVSIKYPGSPISVLGEVEMEPTARIKLTSDAAPGNAAYPLFCSLDEKPQGVFSLGNAPSGCTIKWVGGTAYYSTSSFQPYDYSQAYGYWLGGVNDKWSNAANWSRNTIYSQGTIAAVFDGKDNTIVDNDMDDLSVLSLKMLKRSAPFILKGKSLKVTDSRFAYIVPESDDPRLDMGVSSMSQFPFIVEAEVDSDQEVLGVATAEVGGRGVVALKGGIGAPNSILMTAGTVALGGSVYVRELAISNAFTSYRTRLDGAEASNQSLLMLRRDCQMVVSQQSAANAAMGSIWVNKGATMSVSGLWNWNTYSNEHQIEGLLDICGTIGGNASQGYYGKGVLRVQDTDGTGGASLLTGDGLTVVPTGSNWGTMPLVSVYDTVISNETDWTYSALAGIAVSKPGRRLTFAGEGTATIETAITGYDVELVKEGNGKLVLASSSPELTSSRVFVNRGVLCLNDSQSFGKLTVAPGATLEFGSTWDGLTSLQVNHDVDLQGVKILTAKKTEWSTVLTVPRFCSITGTPIVAGGVHELITNADGSVSLRVRSVGGSVLIFE